MMDNPLLIRNIAVVGNVHHGKTLLMDMLIETTHKQPWDLKKEVRYTDNSISEQERGISIFSTPISLILGDSRDKSYLINFIDTPGHISLCGEVTTGHCTFLRL